MSKGATQTGYGNPNGPSEWAVAEAKARFSELIEMASQAPQTVTRNGKPVAMVVSFEEWRRRTRRNGNLVEFFMNSPLRDSDIDLERVRSQPRDVEL